jgi:hypothetical protein
LVGDRPRDHVWARLCILDVRRTEARDSASLPIPLESPDRQAAAHILDAEPRFRQDAPWAVYTTRQQILEEAGDEPWPLTIWAGAYQSARPMWEKRAETAERAGRLVALVTAWVGIAHCDIGLGALDQAAQRLDRAEALAQRVALAGPSLINLVGARDELCLTLDQGWDELMAALAPATGHDPDLALRSLLAAVNLAVARIAALGDDVDTALALLELSIAPLVAVVPWAVAANRMACDAATVLWLLGRTDHLAAIEQTVRDKVLTPDFRSPMMDPRVSLARLAALDGRMQEARAWFAQARAVLDHDGARPLRAIVDLDEALALYRTGASPAAVGRLIDAAISQLAPLGMIGWLRRAERLAVEVR